MAGRPHFYLFVSVEGARSCGARPWWTLDLLGRTGGRQGGGGGGLGGLEEGKVLHRESHGELANKLASGKEGAAEALMLLGGVGIHLARHSCSCLWLSLTASATLLQSTCVCSLAFPQSARKML